jgi:O-antigen/teichoic acid export membrane protein
MSTILNRAIGAVRDGGFGRSLASLAIKVATAGLTYLMYIALSRMMGESAYGEFAFGLSLATILAVIAGVGQQTAVLRFWPEETGAGRSDKAGDALGAGSALTFLAGVVVTLGMVAVSVVIGLAGDGIDHVTYLLAAALLILPMALAEYNSSALRAQGSVWTALAPRDLVWRMAVCAAVYVVFLLRIELSGASALVLTAGLLVAALILQAAIANGQKLQLAPRPGAVPGYWAARGRASTWFLAGGALETVALNIDIVIVGLFVTHEAAGIYFNAFRTAGLMTLFLFASALVIAPLVSRAFHGGDLRRAQSILAVSAWAGFGFSVLVMTAFLFAGDTILSLFGEGYAEGHLLLIILATGLLVDAATGPARTTMMMTGHEKPYVMIFGAITIAGVVLQIAVVPFYGVLGAAVVNMAARIVAQLAIAGWCIGRIGLDPTILGSLRINRFVPAASP